MWKVGGVGVLVMEEISEGRPAGFVIRWVGKGGGENSLGAVGGRLLVEGPAECVLFVRLDT